jgi:DNA-directed RNA polymerase subunit RPC12/RpoP
MKWGGLFTMEKCVKCNRSDVNLLETGDLRINHIELVCEECLVKTFEEKIKNENLVCDECGSKLKVKIDDGIAWFYCDKGEEHTNYGEYLLEPLDPEEDANWF